MPIVFENARERYKYFINKPGGLNTLCLRCGEIFGEHFGTACPREVGEFLSEEEIDNESNDPNRVFKARKK